MKLYKYYKIPPSDEDNYSKSMHIMDRYPLYAFTNDKKLANRFEKERKKEMFIRTVDKGLSREEYSNFAIDHRGSDLKLQKMVTVRHKNTNRQTVTNIRMVLTQNEYICCNEPLMLITDESWWDEITHCALANPYVFKPEIREALRILQYNVSFKLFNQDINIMDFIDEEDDDYEAPNFIIDEVAVFIKLYGDTFK